MKEINQRNITSPKAPNLTRECGNVTTVSISGGNQRSVCIAKCNGYQLLQPTKFGR